MTFSIAELTRLLEYIPKETAPDLHEKILGALVSKRHYEVHIGLRGDVKYEAQAEFIASLTEAEQAAWMTHLDINTLVEDIGA